jgi:hypothetical protein
LIFCSFFKQFGRLFYKGTSSEEFDDALSAQCDGDVLQTKLKPVKIEDENEND